MPVCTEHGCPVILERSGRCPTHTRARDKARGTRQARGYTSDHDRERARQEPLVARGRAVCPKCGDTIEPGTPWDLGHTEDRTAWTGPEHARCNRQAGGRKAHT